MTVAHGTLVDARVSHAPPRSCADIRIALLGVGQVGSAVARIALARPEHAGYRFRITAGLVRDPLRPNRGAPVPVTADRRAIFDSDPNVVVEALGGLEPARSLVLQALARRIPVVTANKSLLAHHGDELLDAAADAGVPLKYEATVVAGVPFLGAFARRPLASSFSTILGIVNGTTNYILSRVDRDGASYGTALAEAQARGFAEPDPSKDVDGVDALEKLVILVRHFARLRVAPEAVETTGIRDLSPADIVHARELDGTVKPIVYASVAGGVLTTFAGPAFVPLAHPLARLDGVANGVCFQDGKGAELLFAGPGAGPEVTAVTMLDDVLEAVTERPVECPVARQVNVAAPATSWLVRVSSPASLPHGSDIADLLGAHGVRVQRTSARDTREGGEAQWLLTYPYERDRIAQATTALSAAARCSAFLIRAIGLDA